MLLLKSTLFLNIPIYASKCRDRPHPTACRLPGDNRPRYCLASGVLSPESRKLQTDELHGKPNHFAQARVSYSAVVLKMQAVDTRPARWA
jgi:hypothetical protein